MNYITPAGFRDILPEEALRREEIIARVQQSFAAHGYFPLETPTLEVMDVLKAGVRAPEAPFKFFDSQGDLLAMRPDVTMQVARMCGTRLKDSAGPFKFRYTHRVFREADGEMQAAAREMTQLGIESIGESGSAADAEVLMMLAEALNVCGLENYRLAIGTVGILRELLKNSKASDSWKSEILAAYHNSNFVELDRLVKESDGEADYAAAIKKLPRIRGGKEAIETARLLVEPLGCSDGLDSLEATYCILEEAGFAENLLVDFSVMSSFDYYTGFVFEAYTQELGTALGSGGRYDNMLSAFGPSRPAAGFAFYLESVMAACSQQAKEDKGNREKVCVTEASSSETSSDSAGVSSSNIVKDNTAKPLRIAVPKGSLNADTIRVLSQAGLDTQGLEDPGRQLIIRNPGVEYVIVRPTDAPVFVALGAADCGICGKDSLVEADLDVVELSDLGFGACRFIVAEPNGSQAAVEEHYRKLGSIRVATKYPKITKEYYAKVGMQVEIVKLHGNIELAPLTGMAERIVDITATGTTLKENDLVIVDEVLSSTARFFANVSAFRTDARIVELTKAFDKQGKA